jgi:hypothetical protein
MSLKKELLDKLTEKDLKKLAENKGMKIYLTEAQEKYYNDWNEKEKLVDIMSDKEDITIKEIENCIRNSNSK